MRIRSIIPLGLLLSVVIPTGGSVLPTMTLGDSPPFVRSESAWADSVMAGLSLEERVAQLMMVAAWSNKGKAHADAIERLVQDKNIGGLIFFQGGPVRQAILTNRYQAMAKTPLMIGMDLEWGLDMRLDSTFRFPRQMTLGALPDDALIEEMGREIALQMRRLGVHVSFSPVADVNNNPENPVINERSFGEDRERVTSKAIAYMNGLQNGGVIATGKHFPGHGDTDTDSHKALPLINHDVERLDSLELYPFKRLIANGLMAIMVAHLEIPALDTSSNTPTTLSRSVVHDLLQSKLGFSGLIFTDAMNMRGVADVGQPGDLELRALQAGNDILLFPQDPAVAISRIMKAIEDGELDRSVVDEKCLKVLKAKEWLQLHKWDPIQYQGLVEALNPPSSVQLRQKLFNQAVTVLRNKGDLIPLYSVNKKKVAVVTVSAGLDDIFAAEVMQNGEFEIVRTVRTPTESEIMRVVRQVEKADVVIIGIHGTVRSPAKSFGVSDAALKMVRMINDRKPTVVAHFGNPYRLDQESGLQDVEALIVGYEDVPEAHMAVASLLFGASSTKATLPVTVSTDIVVGDGVKSIVPSRMDRATPEEVGMDGSLFAQIDSIALDGIAKRAYPGCQILVAKDGKVIFEKSYGSPTYDEKRPVTEDDIYDLASITKIASTTLSLMKLTDEGKIDPDATLGSYLPELLKDSPEHASMSLRSVLAHQAGLPAWIPFYLKMMEKGQRREGLFADKQQKTDDIAIAERVFIPKIYSDSIMDWILATELRAKKDYKYSDLGYYFMQRIIERVTEMPIEEYVYKTFYKPMGLRKFGYHPLDWAEKEHIIPTEYDPTFRQQLVWGYVHDPGAAMLGGAAGHAGLFGNAEDLAAIMQMLLNGGTYGGIRFLTDEVINEFTKCQFCTGKEDENRRAMGFDKPFRHREGGPTHYGVPLESFGHSGFTGTIAWADPDNDLIYIFLSNRVYPTAENKKLLKMDIRTKIQGVIYSALPEPVVEDVELIAEPLDDLDPDEMKRLSKKERRRLRRQSKK